MGKEETQKNQDVTHKSDTDEVKKRSDTGEVKGTRKESDKDVEKMTVSTTIQKWGNSLAVRIPSAVAEQVSIKQGTEIEISIIEDGAIRIVPKKRPKKYSLNELLEQITPENRHKEIDFGTEGNELI
jgi:antitoxin MazE